MVAVGNHAVWAISRDRRVWFRNGIHGGGSGDSEALARGVKWVGMVGELSMISIGPLGTIHILRKHLYSTKLNFITKFFMKTVFLNQNKRVYFNITFRQNFHSVV